MVVYNVEPFQTITGINFRRRRPRFLATTVTVGRTPTFWDPDAEGSYFCDPVELEYTAGVETFPSVDYLVNLDFTITEVVTDLWSLVESTYAAVNPTTATPSHWPAAPPDFTPDAWAWRGTEVFDLDDWRHALKCTVEGSPYTHPSGAVPSLSGATFKQTTTATLTVLGEPYEAGGAVCAKSSSPFGLAAHLQAIFLNPIADPLVDNGEVAHTASVNCSNMRLSYRGAMYYAVALAQPVANGASFYVLLKREDL